MHANSKLLKLDGDVKLKKTVLFLAWFVLSMGILEGCSKSKEASLPLRNYVYEESSNITKPTIILEKNKKFQFTFSELSSYIGVGTYKISDGRIELDTDDGQYKYFFDIVNETLVFDAGSSSTEMWYSDMKDGAVFK